MTKTKEELNTLKIEYETLTNKLKELTEDELNIVTGGSDINRDLNIIPDKSNIGTNSNENIPPQEVNHRDY